MANPLIDPRTTADIIQQAQEMAPFYTPEWRFQPDAQEPGAALFKIFSWLYSGTISRLNHIPERNHRAFLNMLGVSLLPARSARAPLSFYLSKGADQPVEIPRGVQAAAQVDGEPVIFETTRDFLVSPVSLQAVFSADGITEQIMDHSEAATSGQAFSAFAGRNVQGHNLYLQHENLKDLPADTPLMVILQVRYPQAGSGMKNQEITLPWEWWDGQQWREPLIGPAHTDLELVNQTVPAFQETFVGGAAGYWVRCSVADLEGAECTGITLQFDVAGKRPILFYNDTEILLDAEEDQGFQPFGAYPRIRDAFYIGCSPVLSRRRGTIQLTLTGESTSPPDPNSLQLSWEYWNGAAWVRILPVKEETGRFLFDHSGRQKRVTFPCPDDLQPVKVNGRESHWLRVRITAGDYGQVVYTRSGSIDTSKPVRAPRITSLAISYLGDAISPGHCCIENNLDIREVSEGQSFALYEAPDPACALYLGLQGTMGNGAHSLFLSIDELPESTTAQPQIEWQVLAEERGVKGWKYLAVSGEAQSLVRSGTLAFIAPDGLTALGHLGRELIWIRAVDTRRVFTGGPAVQGGLRITGIYPNTVWVEQVESVAEESPDVNQNTLPYGFTLSRFPVTREALWVDEREVLTEAARIALITAGEYEIQDIKDKEGLTRSFWVKWEAREDFLSSAAGDRHYVIDRALGTVAFGDGHNGAIPPAGFGKIKVDYQSGGGERGNVGPGTIKTLRSSIAYIDRVTNPVAASGGADTELEERAVRRCTNAIKHRGRAVTREDYEELAREASRAVLRAKCITHTSGDGSHESGRITVIIVPYSRDAMPAPSMQLLADVRDYLDTRAPREVVRAFRLKVAGPHYLKVTVTAVLAAAEVWQASSLKQQAAELLAAYLHPLTGGDDGAGWDFGRMPHPSDIYTLLQGLAGLDYVKELALLTQDAVTGETVDSCPAAGLIFSGDHRIKVEGSSGKGES